MNAGEWRRDLRMRTASQGTQDSKALYGFTRGYNYVT